MAGPHGIASSLALVLALGAIASGCGGDSAAKSTKAAAPNQQQQVQDDATAKTNARDLIAQMETCYVDQMTYAPCKLAADGTVAGEDTGLTAGSAPGQVSSTATDVGYVVTAKSKSGNAFVITKADDGTLARTCTPAGKGGCPAAATW